MAIDTLGSISGNPAPNCCEHREPPRQAGGRDCRGGQAPGDTLSPELREHLAKNILQETLGFLKGTVRELIGLLLDATGNTPESPAVITPPAETATPTPATTAPTTPESKCPETTTQAPATATPELTTPAATTPAATTPAATATSPTTTQPNPDNTTPKAAPVYDQAAFESKIRETLRPNAKGQVNEERLQHGVVTYLLSRDGASVEAAYKVHVTEALSVKGTGYEDAVKSSLSQLVKSGTITKERAEAVNGISFRAAQLDKRLDLLFDGKGSKDDNTVAVAKLDTALESAGKIVGDALSGVNIPTPRPLSMPSNKPGLYSIDGGGKPSTAGAQNETPRTGGAAGSEKGFLWKPISDSDGKAVLLLPKGMSKNVKSVELHRDSAEGALIERGKYDGIANGDRAHFRFGRPGKSYPDTVYAVAHFNDGTTYSFKITDTMKRDER